MFRVQDSGFRVQCLGCRIQGLGFTAPVGLHAGRDRVPLNG